MISIKLASIGLAASLAAILPAVAEQAQAPRTFVSAAGSDSNPCSFAAPCRHFQAAVNATSAGGEVDALDPAGYGPIVISQAITIEGQGWSYIAPPAGGNAITINAVGANVVIHGVSLNGAGITGGTNGIVFNSGSRLTVTDCVAQNFNNNGPAATGNGILLQQASHHVNFAITNTNVSQNSNAGIYYLPGEAGTADGVIDHVVASNGINGIAIDTSFFGNGSIAISNSIVSNDNQGISISGRSNSLTVSIDNTSVTGNSNTGISAVGAPVIFLGRSLINANNNVGIDNETSANSIYSYQNNSINGNITDISGFSGALNSLPLR
jgi:hypothetical protein